MAKGNRKRNGNTQSKKVEKKEELLVTKESLLANYPVRTLNNSDVARFKEMVGLSNNVAGLLKQCIDTDMSIEKGSDVAQSMLDGRIKGAAMQKITSNLFLPLNDMKDVAKKIKNEVATLKQANIISKGQLSQRYDEYIDSMRNLRSTLDQLLASAPSKKLTQIYGDRKAKDTRSDEQVIFEKEVEKLTKEDKKFINEVKEKIDTAAKEKSK